MADSYIRVAADGAGKKMQTVENTVGADSVHAEAVLLVDENGDPITELPVDASGHAVPVTDNGGSITVDGPVTDTQLRASAVPISVATVPSHAVTNAGTFAVQASATEADGANVTLGAKADAKSTATDTTAITAMSVLKQISASVQAPPSQAVTNAGTFEVQASIDAAQTLANVTTLGTVTNVVHVDDNSGNLSIDDGGNSITVDAASLPLPALAATSTQQSDGSHKTQVVDGSGNVIGASNNALKVNIASAAVLGGPGINTSVIAAAASIGKSEDAVSADGDVGSAMLAVRKATPANTSGADGDYEFLQMSVGRLWVDPSGVTLTVGSHAVTNAGTFAVQAAESDGANVTLGAKADAKSTATDTTAVTAMSVLKQISASVQAPPSQAVTNAGTFVVQEGDGANVTLGAKADAKSTATDTTAITAMSVLKQISASVQAPPGTAVTNVGTFAVQSTEKPDATSTYAPDNATSSSYEASRVVKGTPGVLFSITCYSSKTTAQFIQIHNAAALPADGIVPVIIFTVPGNSNFSMDFGGKFGRYFSGGIVICNSSTGPTKTIGSADCWFDVQYK